jgi:hypothetical protein
VIYFCSELEEATELMCLFDKLKKTDKQKLLKNIAAI